MTTRIKQAQIDQLLQAAKSAMEDDSVSVADFQEAFQGVLEIIKQGQQKVLDRIEVELKKASKTLDSQSSSFSEESQSILDGMTQAKAAFQTKAEKILSDLQAETDVSFSSIRRRALETMDSLFNRMRVQERLDAIVNDYRGQIETLVAQIPEVPDKDTLIQEVLALVPTVKLPTPYEIRDSLESIQENDEKLSIDAIKDLREKLNALEKKISTKSSGSVIAYSRGRVMTYDLSDKLDGVTKTFALPAFWMVLDVKSSSFPNAFRPTVDYTTNAGTMQITFTSEIDAATTLAVGQSVLILYAEP